MRSDSTIRDYYDALRVKGISHKDSKVAVARKVASLSLALLKNNDSYNDDYEEYLKERKRLRLPTLSWHFK